MPEKVFSIDWDDCIAATKPNEINPQFAYFIKQNKALIQWINTKKIGHSGHICVGSARQTRKLDRYNQKEYRNGSAIENIPLLADHVGTTFHPISMGDVKQRKKIGTCIGEKGPSEISPNDTWYFDRTKISLLYFQMQYFANKFPNKKVDFYFVDDRQDILRANVAFYKAHPHLIPKNITLRLMEYGSYKEIITSPLMIYLIRGTGTLWKNYIDRTYALGRLCFDNEFQHSKQKRNFSIIRTRLESAFAVIHGPYPFFFNSDINPIYLFLFNNHLKALTQQSPTPKQSKEVQPTPKHEKPVRTGNFSFFTSNPTALGIGMLGLPFLSILNMQQTQTATDSITTTGPIP